MCISACMFAWIAVGVYVCLCGGSGGGVCVCVCPCVCVCEQVHEWVWIWGGVWIRVSVRVGVGVSVCVYVIVCVVCATPGGWFCVMCICRGWHYRCLWKQGSSPHQAAMIWQYIVNSVLCGSECIYRYRWLFMAMAVDAHRRQYVLEFLDDIVLRSWGRYADDTLT